MLIINITTHSMCLLCLFPLHDLVIYQGVIGLNDSCSGFGIFSLLRNRVFGEFIVEEPASQVCHRKVSLGPGPVSFGPMTLGPVYLGPGPVSLGPGQCL